MSKIPMFADAIEKCGAADGIECVRNLHRQKNSRTVVNGLYANATTSLMLLGEHFSQNSWARCTDWNTLIAPSQLQRCYFMQTKYADLVMRSMCTGTFFMARDELKFIINLTINLCTPW